MSKIEFTVLESLFLVSSNKKNKKHTCLPARMVDVLILHRIKLMRRHVEFQIFNASVTWNGKCDGGAPTFRVKNPYLAVMKRNNLIGKGQPQT